MITVVCWLWRGNRLYLPEHVNVLAKMLKRHLTLPHRVVCISELKNGFSKDVEYFPMPESAKKLGEIKSPEGVNYPSCYRRLWMFSEEARALGERVMMIDIDVVITGNIDHLFEYDADFVGWAPRSEWGKEGRIGGGMYFLTPGTCNHVYDDFKGYESIKEARDAGHRGSDQAWITYKMYGKCPIIDPDSGIYSLNDFDAEPPEDACLVQYIGNQKPWQIKSGWVAEHWR